MTESALPRRCLVDTNVLLRVTQPADEFPHHHRALAELYRAGATLFTTFQNIAEYWNAATRPLDKKGFGLSHSSVRKEVDILLIDFVLITETPNTFDIWLDLVTAHQVSGRQVHDARLVAHMLAHNIPALLTSNTKDFTRYPDIQLLDPEHIA